MAIQQQHEIHGRRLGRNVGLALTLVAFVAIVFGLTLVKTKREGAFSQQAPAAEASQ